MSERSLESLQDCDDFIAGCQFMGTGGGGDPARGRLFLQEALADGFKLAWTALDQIPDQLWTCSTYAMGSIAPWTAETEKLIEQLGLVDRYNYRAMAVAVQELANYAQVEIGALVAAELGPSNTPAPLITAARMGIKLVDGDYAGRAVPEEFQSTHYLAGKNGWPFCSVDRWGNTVIVKEACNSYMMERIGKMLSVASYRGCAIAASLMRADEMKQIVVPGTLSRCLRLGRRLRQAQQQGTDPITTAIDFTNGWLLFTGTVVNKEWRDSDGYMIGTTTINGEGKFTGHKMSVWFKNENQICWLDDQPYVTSPDLIVIADRNTGQGITNTALSAGMMVAVIGIAGLTAFRSAAGLAAAGPRHFGFQIDYRPIEEIVSS